MLDPLVTTPTLPPDATGAAVLLLGLGLTLAWLAALYR
jgi:hypothetical protein